jgi:hypothetical protein
MFFSDWLPFGKILKTFTSHMSLEHDKPLAEIGCNNSNYVFKVNGKTKFFFLSKEHKVIFFP